MELLWEYLPFLVPLILAQIVFAAIALVQIFKHPHYRFGNKIMWIIVVCLFQFIGPILYFVLGRGEE